MIINIAIKLMILTQVETQFAKICTEDVKFM